MRPGQNERNLLPLRNGKSSARFQVFAKQFNRARKEQAVRTCYRLQTSIGYPAHPGDNGSVVEAQRQLHLHIDTAAYAADDSDNVLTPAMASHAVNQQHCSLRGGELGFENQRALPAAPLYARMFGFWANRPAAIFRCAQQCGQAGGGVETGKTEPVDGAIASHHSRCRVVADQRIVFDKLRHQFVENSMMTLMSSGLRFRTSRQFESLSRREISFESQPRSASSRAFCASS